MSAHKTSASWVKSNERRRKQWPGMLANDTAGGARKLPGPKAHKAHVLYPENERALNRVY